MNEFQTLSDIKPGQTVRVRALTATGSIRRRLLDMGLIKDTAVTCLGVSPFGDPSAYLIRGAVIAIRKTDSRNILIE